MKKLKTYQLKDFYGEDYILAPYIAHYSNNNTLAVYLIEQGDFEPFANVTVNLNMYRKLQADCAYIDTNNCEWLPKFLQENGIAFPTGEIGFSGMCVYPEYKFNLEKLNKEKD